MCVFALALIAGCGSHAPFAQQQTAYMKAITAETLRTPRPAIPYYPVRDAFGEHPVHLTASQRAWLLRILHSKTYGGSKASIYFAPIAATGVPLVVYVDDNPPNAIYHIIGTPCNDYYNAAEGTEFPAPDCMNPTPKPVIP